MSSSPQNMLSVACRTTAIAIGALLLTSASAQAEESLKNRGRFDDPRIARGFDVAPVPLNLKGRNADLVGIGSYIVNTQGDCNGCHSASPATQFANGGNPYFGQKEVTNPATYLGGGRDFGAFPAEGPFPHIVSRNLTPGKTGMPAGDLTYAEFRQIMRTGVDVDKAHPTCNGAPNGSCLPPPFDGSRLQIMPWPAYMYMLEADLRAIYEYLSAIPCLEGGPGQAPNRCK
ncbi:MAG: cytochrome C [Pseudomonadota bacterium]|nr:cytochrome C [Pseudomonadota bacterium]